MLLALERRDLDRQLGGHGEVAQVDAAVAREVGAVREIGVLADGIVLPAACGLDRVASPDPRRPVEVEHVATARAHRLLEDEVPVHEHAHALRERAERPVQVVPAALDESDGGVREVVDGPTQEVGIGHEVGVEDRQVVTAGLRQRSREGAGLVARAIGPVDVADVEAAASELCDLAGGDLDRVVRAVVEDLYLQLVSGPVQRADGLEQPLDDEALVEERELDRDDGFRAEPLPRLLVFAGAPVVPEDQEGAVRHHRGHDREEGVVHRQEEVLGEGHDGGVREGRPARAPPRGSGRRGGDRTASPAGRQGGRAGRQVPSPPWKARCRVPRSAADWTSSVA